MAETPSAKSSKSRFGFVGQWNRRLAAIAGVSALVILFLAWSLRPQPVGADFAAVERGDLLVTIDDEGETRIHDVYVVSAPVAGRVERIELEVGDPVVANETVLALFQPSDPALQNARSMSEAEAGVGLARAERDRAAAQLEFAEADLARNEKLFREGNVSQAAFDRARLSMETARAALAQAQASLGQRMADLETARAALAAAGRPSGPDVKFSYIQVRAPVNGRVLKRMQQSAAVLATGTPLLEIGDPANLEIVTDLLSADAVKVKAGNRVIIDEWGGDEPLEGIVRLVEPFGFAKISALGIEEQRVNVIMDFISPQERWASLGHGYRVMTRIVIHDRKNVLKIPVSALFRTGADWTVFVDGGGAARLRTVTLGERNALEAEIATGLDEGEQVILHPSDQIADGVGVVARE